MANGLFAKFKERLLIAGINLNTDTIKIALIDTNDVNPDLSTHEFFDDIDAAVVGTPQTLTSKTYALGVFDAADPTFPLVTGDQCEAVVIYKDTGSPATSPLIAKFDTGATGLPVTPNGGGIGVQFHASGIFSL